MSQRTRSLVTGSSSGIGLAIVKKLAAAGHQVFGCARNIEALKTLDCEGSSNIHAIICDVTNEEQVKAMFEEITRVAGGLDICVNNAGIAINEPLVTGNPESWKKMYEVNVIGLCIVTQNAVRLMKEGGGDDCKILNINSTLGLAKTKHLKTFASFYIGTKHAVTGITSALRGEISQSGLGDKIRVMQVCPGRTQTEFAQRGLGADTTKAIFSEAKPLQADDVASSVIYVLSAPKHATITDLVLHPTELID